MSAGPKDNLPRVGRGRDRVSLIVGLGLFGLTLGGILAIFSAPLLALVGR